jgi:flagellar motor switch protein FliG
VKQQSVRKAAVFLMSLGPDVAGRVMAKLPESMVEELTHNIASIGHVTFQ